MYTTHGDHIPGTRLGDNPPLRNASCGGIRRCPDCMTEAAAVTKLDYYREETYSDKTMTRVFLLMCNAGISWGDAQAAIVIMEDDGILFRERKKK